MNYFCNMKTAHGKGRVMPGCKKRGEAFGGFITIIIYFNHSEKSTENAVDIFSVELLLVMLFA